MVNESGSGDEGIHVCLGAPAVYGLQSSLTLEGSEEE